MSWAGAGDDWGDWQVAATKTKGEGGAQWGEEESPDYYPQLKKCWLLLSAEKSWLLSSADAVEIGWFCIDAV